MAKHLYLMQDERTVVEQLIKSGRHQARVLNRARVLLLLDRGQAEARTLVQVAEATLLTRVAVGNIKRRYFGAGLDVALYDKPRPDRPVTKMTGDVEAHLIALTCSKPPDGYDQWSLRLLAEGLVSLKVVDSLSHVTVGKT